MGHSTVMELLASPLKLLYYHVLKLELEGAKPFWGRVNLSNRLESLVLKIASQNIRFLYECRQFLPGSQTQESRYNSHFLQHGLLLKDLFLRT